MFHHKSFSTKSFSRNSWRFSGVSAADLPPVFRRAGPLRITPAQRRKLHASAGVALGFAVSSHASLRLGAASSVHVMPSVQASASLALSGRAAGTIEYRHSSTADAVDVVLEAILLAS